MWVCFVLDIWGCKVNIECYIVFKEEIGKKKIFSEKI